MAEARRDDTGSGGEARQTMTKPPLSSPPDPLTLRTHSCLSASALRSDSETRSS